MNRATVSEAGAWNTRAVSSSDPAGHQHRHTVAERLSLTAVVSHEHGGDAIVTQDGRDLRQEIGARGRVEPGERLVEQEHLGLEHERARQRHALRLASRERSRPLTSERRDREPLEPALDARAAIVRAAAEREPQRHVLGDGHVGQERMLEDGRHPPALGQRVRGVGRAPAKPNDALARALEQSGDAQQRRLAAAVRADHDQDLALVDPERRHVEHRRAAVAYPHAGQLDNG